MITADALLGAADVALRTLGGGARAGRPTPQAPERTLDERQRRLSAALMRVNHVGEVCAQALYQAQALTARDPVVRQELNRAAREEIDHLAWTEQRLRELGDRTSLLNPLWYAGAFAIGLVAGRAGDAVSLGFLAETERQVEQHLASHLDRLPTEDERSRAVVAQMKIDEAEHAAYADNAGAAELPKVVKGLMRAASRVMTFTAHHI